MVALTLARRTAAFSNHVKACSIIIAYPFDCIQVHVPEGLTYMDLDILKVTAQFVARNGKSFLTGLSSREHTNPQVKVEQGRGEGWLKRGGGEGEGEEQRERGRRRGRGRGGENTLFFRCPAQWRALEWLEVTGGQANPHRPLDTPTPWDSVMGLMLPTKQENAFAQVTGVVSDSAPLTVP